MSIETSIGLETGQPYAVPPASSWSSPTGPGFPGWRDVTARAVGVGAVAAGPLRQERQAAARASWATCSTSAFYADLERDQAERATMSMLVPPQMINTMVPRAAPRGPGLADRGVLRRPGPPLHAAGRSPTGAPTGRRHPHATRDSLHEHDMWVAEGLTHRYPTKVLAELLPTCPQYCGHCTRMDLVGNSTPTVDKLKFDLKPVDRLRRA